MLWVTSRQHRAQVLITAALLAGTGVFLLVHGLRTADPAAGVAAPDLERVLDRRRSVSGGRRLR